MNVPPSVVGMLRRQRNSQHFSSMLTMGAEVQDMRSEMGGREGVKERRSGEGGGRSEGGRGSERGGVGEGE